MLLMLASPAWATPATLKRSIENITQAPLDLLVAPYIAGESIVRNMQEIDDTLGVRIAYPIPGYVWNLLVQVGTPVLREMTGVLEFVPGLVVAFTHADLDPLFDPVEDNDALVDYDEIPFYRIKFGVHYTAGGGY